MFFAAVDCEQQVSDQSGQDLHQQAIGAACNQGVNLQVALPPAKKGFDGPAQLLDQRDLLGAQVKAVGGHPVVLVVHLVTDHAQVLFGQVDVLGAEQHYGIVKHEAFGIDGIGAQYCLSRAGLNTADKMAPLALPFVKILVALVIAIQYGGLAGSGSRPKSWTGLH
jgi:hypothetical protein